MLIHSFSDLSGTPAGIGALVAFGIAYALVVTEDWNRLRKSEPVLLTAGVIWLLVAIATGDGGHIADRVKEHLADFAEVFLFLLAAMTYVTTIAERNVFHRLNAWLVSAGFGLRAVFWLTGALSFCLSPIADNLTTALVLGAVVVTAGGANTRFVSLACINVVVAANAGGAFSPFGDITTLMVWQAGKVATVEFLELVPASVVNWLVPAVIMSLAVPRGAADQQVEVVELRAGWWIVVALFIATITTAVSFHAVFHLPPFLGMTTGLSYLFVYGYLRRIRVGRRPGDSVDVFKNVAGIEWDTVLFFFGVIMCVGGLRELGHLAHASTLFYDGLGPFWANVSVGVLSALVDNVPVMFAVLGMSPDMAAADWLLITLTAGVGGSLLSIGSAAGVGIMGVAHGRYTFVAHLRWMPVIALGYAASIGVHELTQWLLFGE